MLLLTAAACLLAGCAGQAESGSLSQPQSESAPQPTQTEAQTTQSPPTDESADSSYSLDYEGTLYYYEPSLSFFYGERGAEKLDLAAETPEDTFEEYIADKN